ncbi:hybrid sensor histidine kinase/response regulator [Microcoleus sp. FACHB-831]|uniref:ATP-binding response regulator n=1 Tax=Microcoleus sp. FACHB-831 TaxID=2692827 RepID=UPI001685B90E|nr:ATP-binding protein [Microcoleus sp. FACHB-831]MBD1919700.1 hybrid sensor histidine kinase/response regulator [Microcoleus sp. FACHB-831]
MKRILLLFLDNNENSRLLLEWLTSRYEIIVPNLTVEAAELLDESFDLCILDGGALNLFAERVRVRKKASLPVFLPFLLVTSTPDEAAIAGQLGQSFDEVIVSPTEKLQLQARVRILLQNRQLSLAIHNANQEIKGLNEVKSRMVSMVSHELRNPLSAILFSAQLLQQFGDRCPPEAKRKYFNLIQERVEYMTGLLDDVLILGYAELAMQLNPQLLELETFCGNLIEEIQLSASEKHAIVFTFDSRYSLVYLDEKLLGHILSNLLTNAIKYSPEGGKVSLEVSCLEREVIFRVTDEGIGIPSEDQLQLFESFHRGANVGKIQGTGLGLAIVKQCVERHGGAIALNSEVGAGTTFIVTLPLSSAIS